MSCGAKAGRRRMLGVLGGMGPAATALFLAEMAAQTDADGDQGHADVAVVGRASLPDRTRAMGGAGETELVRGLVEATRGLVELGAEVLAMPCNTAHRWLAGIRQAAGPGVGVLDMVALAAARAARLTGDSPVGVLATDGTRAAGLYDRALARAGSHAVWPDDMGQSTCMGLVRAVKAGRPVPEGALGALAERLAARGCGAVVLGCTELSVLRRRDLAAGARGAACTVDALDELVRASIVRCGAHLR